MILKSRHFLNLSNYYFFVYRKQVMAALPVNKGVKRSYPTNNGPPTITNPEEKETINEDGFIQEGDYVVVYTDGACASNGQKGALAGIGVWFGKDHPLNISEPVIGRQTNNVAEIQAAERAVLTAKSIGLSKLMIKTDSKFLISCITIWMKNWIRNGWRSSNKKEVINRLDLEKLNEALVGMDVKWIHIAGHKGHMGNEAADRLAVEGANKIKSKAGTKRKREDDE